ncbi:MAG: UPF0158 family protein [candidate division WOR-3 bacterium]
MRTIKVSTRDLLFALTSRMPDTSHYLDTETGEVVPVFSFNRDRILAMVKVNPERYVRIAPQSPGRALEMMKRFAGTVTRPALRERLEAALREDHSFRQFRTVLRESPIEYRRWQRFRTDTMTQALRMRLKQRDIELELVTDED